MKFYAMIVVMLLMLAMTVFGLVCWDDHIVPMKPTTPEHAKDMGEIWKTKMEKVGKSSPIGMPLAVTMTFVGALGTLILARMAYNEDNK